MRKKNPEATSYGLEDRYKQKCQGANIKRGEPLLHYKVFPTRITVNSFGISATQGEAASLCLMAYNTCKKKKERKDQYVMDSS